MMGEFLSLSLIDNIVERLKTYFPQVSLNVTRDRLVSI